MRNILMFGWEFPPHISGGLGTACLGLTLAMQKEHCNILFVVPRAKGDEPVPLINASAVLVDQQWQEISWRTQSKVTGSIQLIAIPANVLPYGHQDVPNEFRTDVAGAVKAESGQTSSISGGRMYQFKGGYGPNLFGEVENYSKVAAQIACDNDFEVIHAHDWFTFPAGVAAKRASGKPLVLHVHSTEYDRAGEYHLNPYVVQVEREGMMVADKIIAVSDWTKSIIVSRYSIPASKVVVVHNGLFRHRARNGKPNRELDRVVTFLGRITFQKGPAYFIDAARLVLRYLPEVHFVMAGAGDLFPEMIEDVARNKMSRNFHFTGFLTRDEMDELWSMTDLYVMPSVSEPFGLTPLEAIRAGVPVIVSNQSGVSEVLPHAIKVDFWDVEKLAENIVSVLMHESLSAELKSNGKRQIRLLTWQKAAKKILRIYDKLADNPLG
jgi:glycogen synthase